MTEENYKPLPPPHYKYTKPFNGLVALLTWVGVSLVILYFTKEGHSRQETLFIIMIVLEVILAVWVAYMVFTGKNIRHPDPDKKV